jgi:U3 small nucleolar RNA-associated protein 15
VIRPASAHTRPVPDPSPHTALLAPAAPRLPLSGGKLLKRLANFQKTVTCVALSPLAGPAAAAAPRLLAGSLDGHVKVFELDAFTVTHATKYPAPVLSLGLSGDAGLLAVGLADGTLTVRKHARPKAAAIGGGGGGAAGGGGKAGGLGRAARRRARLEMNAGNFRYFLRGRGAKAAPGDFAVAQRRRARLAPYDKLLKRFLYRWGAAAAAGRGEIGGQGHGSRACRLDWGQRHARRVGLSRLWAGGKAPSYARALRASALPAL